MKLYQNDRCVLALNLRNFKPFFKTRWRAEESWRSAFQPCHDDDNKCTALAPEPPEPSDGAVFFSRRYLVDSVPPSLDWEV